MSYLLLIACYLLLFLFLSFKNLKWAIYWVIFSLPAYQIRFDIFGLPATLLELEILIVFLVWVIKLLKHKNIRRWVEILKQGFNKNLLLLYCPITLLLAAAAFSVFISPNLRAAAGLWKAYFIEPVLFFIVFVNITKNDDLKKIFKVFSFQVLILSLFAVYQKITGAFILNSFWAAEATRRVTGVFGYPNALALYLAPIVVLLIGRLVERGKEKGLKFKRLFAAGYLLLVICLGLLAIYFTKSKGALMAILVGILFYAIFYKRYRRFFIGILVAVILLTGYFVLTGKSDWQGVATVEGGDSVSTRLEIWQETWQMLKTRLFLGVGLAGYQVAVAPFHQKNYIEIYLYPHNIFLNFWAETGLLGLIGFILIVIWFYRTGFKASRALSVFGSENNNFDLKVGTTSVIIMSAMATLLAHGLVDVPYFKNDLAVLFWVIAGMMASNTQNPINKE